MHATTPVARFGTVRFVNGTIHFENDSLFCERHDSLLARYALLKKTARVVNGFRALY